MFIFNFKTSLHKHKNIHKELYIFTKKPSFLVSR